MNRTLYTFAFAALFGLAGCSTGLNSVNQTPVINNAKQLEALGPGVFIFRAGKPVDDAAINIYVDGHYLTSLQQFTYRYVDLCPGEHTVSYAYHYKDPAYFNKLRTSEKFNLIGKEVKYLNISADSRGDAALVLSTKDIAAQLLPDIRQQNHTLSRVTEGRRCYDKRTRYQESPAYPQQVGNMYNATKPSPQPMTVAELLNSSEQTPGNDGWTVQPQSSPANSVSELMTPDDGVDVTPDADNIY